MNIKKYQFKKRFIAIFMVVALVGIFVAPLTANAAEPSAKEINDDAKAYCDKKYDKNEEAQSGACRNGYRGAFDAQSPNETCGEKRAKEYGTKAEKTACEYGFQKGVELVLAASQDKDPNRDAEEGSAADVKDKGNNFFTPTAASEGGGQCGHSDSGGVKTRFNFGCIGNEGPTNMGPLEDFAYAVIRFLTAGVGIVIVLFVILAGIQYSASEGNADKTQEAKNKIRDAIIGLFVYLISFALVQFLVPGGVFKASMVVPPPRNIAITTEVIHV